MSGKWYAESRKIEAIREMGWQRHTGGEAIQSYGISTPLLYACIRLQSERHGLLAELDELRTELRQLKHDLQEASDERDMLRNGHQVMAVTLGAQKRRPKGPPESDRAARRARRVCAPDWA